jgi:hypothetical protein
MTPDILAPQTDRRVMHDDAVGDLSQQLQVGKPGKMIRNSSPVRATQSSYSGLFAARGPLHAALSSLRRFKIVIHRLNQEIMIHQQHTERTSPRTKQIAADQRRGCTGGWSWVVSACSSAAT